MQTSRGSDLADSCPESVSTDLRALYSSICELLRHFWACFPPTTPALQEKVRNERILKLHVRISNLRTNS